MNIRDKRNDGPTVPFSSLTNGDFFLFQPLKGAPRLYLKLHHERDANAYDCSEPQLAGFCHDTRVIPVEVELSILANKG